jgi:capsular polysaccharide biosynthesis protein
VPAIPIKIVNEATLPTYPSPAALCDSSVQRGRCELIPPTSRRVSEWSSGRFRKAGHPTPEWWQDDPVVSGRAVEVLRLADAYYFPPSGSIISVDGEAMESAVDELRATTHDNSLQKLPFVKVRSGSASFSPPAQLPRLDRAIVTFPAGGVTYGHFVLDCLTGVAATLGADELRGGPYVFPPLWPWQLRHLELVGITSPLIADISIYRVAQLFFTNCMAHNLHSPNVHFLTLRDIQLSNVSGGPPSGVGERIYVSRRGGWARSLLDESELESRLAKLGFSIVQPELYKVDQQIQMFHRAKVVVGPTGSGFANVIYCRPGTLVVEITPAAMFPKAWGGYWVGWLCALTGSRWRPYYCEGQSERTWALQVDMRFNTDKDQLIRYILAEIGE